MIRYAPPVLLLAAALGLPAQQTGSPNRDYVINGTGSFQASVVSTSIPTPALPMSNVYNTQDANQLVLWAYASQSVINWIPGLLANSVDIGPAGLTFLLDGPNAPTPLNLFLRTGPNGTFAFTLATTQALSGSSGYFLMAHASPPSPDGFYVSQTHQVNFTPASSPTCNSAATNLALGDDTFAFRTLGFSFAFYGTSYTAIYVGSNGTLCFGNGNAGFEFDPVSFVGAAEPQAAALTCDLDPSSGGSVTFWTDNVGTMEACWNQLPEYGYTNSNTFKATLSSIGFIQFDYGQLDADGTNQDVLVGLTPGNNLATAQSIDLTTGPNLLGGATSAPLEYFSSFPITGFPTNFVDLDFRTLIFQLDANGNPVLQL